MGFDGGSGTACHQEDVPLWSGVAASKPSNEGAGVMKRCFLVLSSEFPYGLDTRARRRAGARRVARLCWPLRSIEGNAQIGAADLCGA